MHVLTEGSELKISSIHKELRNLFVGGAIIEIFFAPDATNMILWKCLPRRNSGPG
jgi:hypothetical protein